MKGRNETMVGRNKSKQLGAVAIFTVIFAALLIMIVTMSFVGLMIKDQEQATDADLSQSAYDSAQAGVEDAKRALLLYQNVCDGGSESDCSAAKATIDSATSPACNAAISTLDDVSGSITEDDGVKIQTGDSSDLNQAYTCVKIDLDTTDYLGSLSANEYDLVPLSGVSSFNKVKIEWFSSEDISSGENFAVNLQSDSATPLLAQTNWPLNRPSIIQAQLIQYGSNGFTLGNLNSAVGAQSDVNTLFLYPSSVGLTGYPFVGTDSGKTPTNIPRIIKCKASLADGGYACSATLTLPDPIGGGNRTAYVYIGALYNNTNYRVTLYDNNNNSVDFNGVQPEIDSTGRANDLFRRVKVRVAMIDSSFPYPTAAVSVSDNLCKNFIVTNEDSGYSTSCNP